MKLKFILYYLMKMNLTVVLMTQSRKLQLHYHQQMIETMSANYFAKIRKFFNFVDNNGLTNEGTSIENLIKIRPILSELKKNF